MTRTLVVLALLTSACGGGGTAPSLNPTGPFAGTWTATITITQDSQTVSGPATLTLTTAPNESGLGYVAQFQTQTALLAINTNGHASTFPGSTPPTDFKLDLTYPAGACFGTLMAVGKADTTRHVVADVSGYALCPASRTPAVWCWTAHDERRQSPSR